MYNYQGLPKKRMAAGALFLNERGDILIVKPTYRPEWLLPGGVVEEHESPREGCMREIREELKLDVVVERFLCVEYLAEEGQQTECLQFVFAGGVLHDRQIADIVLSPEELSEYRFVPLAEAQQLLSRRLAKRIPYCLQAYEDRTTVYLEGGCPVC